jgi:hypothetical protein
MRPRRNNRRAPAASQISFDKYPHVGFAQLPASGTVSVDRVLSAPVLGPESLETVIRFCEESRDEA